MKRALFLIIVIIGILTWPCLGFAADQPALRDVKFDNPDKQAVAAVILELEQYYNADEPDKLMSLFTADAQLLTAMKGNRKGDWVTKKEYAGIVERKMAQLAFFGFGIIYYKPSLLEVKSQSAMIKLPYMSASERVNYREKGFFEFGLVRAGGKWLIKKMSWAVTDDSLGTKRSISDTDAACF